MMRIQGLGCSCGWGSFPLWGAPLVESSSELCPDRGGEGPIPGHPFLRLTSEREHLGAMSSGTPRVMVPERLFPQVIKQRGSPHPKALEGGCQGFYRVTQILAILGNWSLLAQLWQIVFR